MSIKLSDLAKKLDFSTKDLRDEILNLGFEISPRARTIEEDLAELIEEEIQSRKELEGDLNKDPEDIAEVYDELIAQEREREIVKSQRSRTAGKKETKKKKSEEDDEKPQKISGVIEIPESISVKELAEKAGLSVAKIIGELMKNGILANINQQIDFETASILAEELGIKLKRRRDAAGVEELMSGDLTKLLEEDDASDLEERPPVVCVMGHVDHGKTKLLDSIRQADVVSGESGGITQHIGAYKVTKKGKEITFLDTPGHEAFTSMRARGAKVTDIVILVVAADEGMKPQTIEALNHAKDAEVPIIVAVNKMDKPEANLEKVKGELSEHGLQPEDWGGKTIVVPVSALKGEGIEELLDMVLLTAEIEELKANPEREAVGTVVEAHLDQNFGPVATILVNTGTLKIMNNFIVGDTYGRIKVMQDHNGKALRTAGPSTPVFIAGLNETPKSGDVLHVVQNEKIARQKAAEMKLIIAEKAAGRTGAQSVLSQLHSDKILKLILKADAKGSLEAIKQSLAKIKDEEVAIKIIHSAVGTVTDSDVMMATAANGIILAFHSEFDSPNVEKSADRESVMVKKYEVIYDLIEDIKLFLTGLLEPEMREVELGRLKVKQIFLTKKKEMIIGGKVTKGLMQNKAKLRVITEDKEDPRWIAAKKAQSSELTANIEEAEKDPEEEKNKDFVVGEGRIESLQKGTETTHEVKEGNECGIKFTGKVKVLEGDILQAYKVEEVKRSLK